MDQPDSTSSNHESLTRSKRKAAHDANPKTKLPSNIHNDPSMVSVDKMTPGTLKGILREYRIHIPKGAKVAELRELYKESVLPIQREAYLPPAPTSPSNTRILGQSIPAPRSSFSLPAVESTWKPLDYLNATNKQIKDFLAAKGVSTGSKALKSTLHTEYLSWESQQSNSGVCDPVPEPEFPKPSGFHECTIPVLQRHLRGHGFPYSGLRKTALIERCQTNNLPLPSCKTLNVKSSDLPDLMTSDPSNPQLIADTPHHLLEETAQIESLVPVGTREVTRNRRYLSKKQPPASQDINTLIETTDSSAEIKDGPLTPNHPASRGTDSSLEYMSGSSTSSTDEDDISETAEKCQGEGRPTFEENYEKTEGVIKDHREDQEDARPGALDHDRRNEPQTKTNTNVHQKDHLRLISPVPQICMTQGTPAKINTVDHHRAIEPEVVYEGHKTCESETSRSSASGSSCLSINPLPFDKLVGVAGSEPHYCKEDSQDAFREAVPPSHQEQACVSPRFWSRSQEKKGKFREEPSTSPRASSSNPSNQHPHPASHSNNNTTNDKLDTMMTLLEKLTLSHDLVQHNTTLTNRSLQDLEGTLGDVQLEQMATSEKLESLAITLTNFLESNEERHGSPTTGSRGNGPPTSRRYKSQGGKVSAAIRLCSMSLIGRRPEDETFPEPANDAEKRQWMHDMLKHPANSEIVRVPGDTPDRTDPQFPFKSGPGHLKATSTQLQIMRTMLLQHGVRRFRPDFNKSYKSTDNSFLWGLAIKIFLRLVAAGEYPGVSLESAPREVVEAEFQLHVTDCLKRRDRQERNLTPAQLAAQKARTNMASRLFSLRCLRQTVAADTAGLEALSMFVSDCCSEDELQDEDNFEDCVVGASKPKTCEVLDLEWRSEECENVVIALDSLRENHRRMSPATPRGVQYRVRIRHPRSQRKKSSMEAPEGLTIDCYRPSFLRSRTEAEKAILKINMVPGLQKFKDILL